MPPAPPPPVPHPPIPPPGVINPGLNQFLATAYGNPTNSMERAMAATKRLKLAEGSYVTRRGEITENELTRIHVHATGAQITAAVDAHLVDLQAIQNQVLVQTIQQAVQQAVDPITQQIATITQQLATITQHLAPLTQAVQRIESGLVEVHNDVSRIHNAKAGHPDFRLKSIKKYVQAPVQAPGAVLPAVDPVHTPPNFPATYSAYGDLTHVEKRNMLVFYTPAANAQNAVHGQTDEALRRHLGLPVRPVD